MESRDQSRPSASSTTSVCPICSTTRLRAIYGLPTSEFADDPTMKLMGCLTDGEMPKWFCPECDQGRN